MNILRSASSIFQEKFQGHPMLVRSPGRVNLIGEHTDYNMGFVLPAAIDKAVYFAIAPREDARGHLYAMDMRDSFEFSFDHFQPVEKRWPNYLMGVVQQLRSAGYPIKGFNCVFGGDVPVGAGMSSSAAIEGGLAFSLNALFDLHIDRLTLVKLAQKAENEFVGVRCGIMDQYINIFGKQDQVLRIDCRSLECQYYPFPFQSVSIVLFDTQVTHSLASSEYNRRREECSEGVEVVRKVYPDVQSLRDVTRTMLNTVKDRMTERVFRRCSYVVAENDRVVQACRELEQGNLNAFGRMMNESHWGLSVDYDVSCPELDFLAEQCSKEPPIYGSRMMGGGFGGCTINLIEKKEIERVQAVITERYRKQFKADLKTYVTTIGPGTQQVSHEEYHAA